MVGAEEWKEWQAAGRRRRVAAKTEEEEEEGAMLRREDIKVGVLVRGSMLG